jgi:hypothetical protein
MNVLESYRGISRSFHSSLNQSLIMTLVAQEVLRNWPESLPQEIKEPLILGTKEVVDLYIGTIHNKGTREHFLAEFTKKKVDWQAGGKLPDLYVATVSLLLVTAKQCPNTNQIDFTRIVYSQALVMQFAQLDAFMSDSMRIICQTCPEVLKSDKTMNWTDILSCGEWDKILDWIIEKFVYDFGWQSLRKRLEILDKRIGLAIDFADEQIRQIEAAELVRNLITHNGGNINQKYIDATGQINLAVGQRFPLDADLVIKTHALMVELGIAVFTAISKKFYEDEPIVFF